MRLFEEREGPRKKKDGEREMAEREGDPAGTPHETRPGSRSTNTEAVARAVGGQWEGVVYYYCKSSAGD